MDLSSIMQFMPMIMQLFNSSGGNMNTIMGSLPQMISQQYFQFSAKPNIPLHLNMWDLKKSQKERAPDLPTGNAFGLSIAHSLLQSLGFKNSSSILFDTNSGSLTEFGNLMNKSMNKLMAGMGHQAADYSTITQRVMDITGDTNVKPLVDDLLSGTYSNSSMTESKLGFSIQDTLDIFESAKQRGALTGKRSDIGDRLQRIAEVVKESMQLFQSDDKDASLQALLDTIGNDVDLTDTSKLKLAVEKIRKLSEAVGLAVPQVQEFLKSTSNLSQQMGMTGSTGFNIGSASILSYRNLTPVSSQKQEIGQANMAVLNIETANSQYFKTVGGYAELLKQYGKYEGSDLQKYTKNPVGVYNPEKDKETVISEMEKKGITGARDNFGKFLMSGSKKGVEFLSEQNPEMFQELAMQQTLETFMSSNPDLIPKRPEGDLSKKKIQLEEGKKVEYKDGVFQIVPQNDPIEAALLRGEAVELTPDLEAKYRESLIIEDYKEPTVVRKNPTVTDKQDLQTTDQAQIDAKKQQEEMDRAKQDEILASLDNRQRKVYNEYMKYEKIRLSDAEELKKLGLKEFENFDIQEERAYTPRYEGGIVVKDWNLEEAAFFSYGIDYTKDEVTQQEHLYNKHPEYQNLFSEFNTVKQVIRKAPAPALTDKQKQIYEKYMDYKPILESEALELKDAGVPDFKDFTPEKKDVQQPSPKKWRLAQPYTAKNLTLQDKDYAQILAEKGVVEVDENYKVKFPGVYEDRTRENYAKKLEQVKPVVVQELTAVLRARGMQNAESMAETYVSTLFASLVNPDKAKKTREKQIEESKDNEISRRNEEILRSKKTAPLYDFLQGYLVDNKTIDEALLALVPIWEGGEIKLNAENISMYTKAATSDYNTKMSYKYTNVMFGGSEFKEADKEKLLKEDIEKMATSGRAEINKGKFSEIVGKVTLQELRQKAPDATLEDMLAYMKKYKPEDFNELIGIQKNRRSYEKAAYDQKLDIPRLTPEQLEAEKRTAFNEQFREMAGIKPAILRAYKNLSEVDSLTFTEEEKKFVFANAPLEYRNEAGSNSILYQRLEKTYKQLNGEEKLVEDAYSYFVKRKNVDNKKEIDPGYTTNPNITAFTVAKHFIAQGVAPEKIVEELEKMGTPDANLVKELLKLRMDLPDNAFAPKIKEKNQQALQAQFSGIIDNPVEYATKFYGRNKKLSSYTAIEQQRFADRKEKIQSGVWKIEDVIKEAFKQQIPLEELQKLTEDTPYYPQIDALGKLIELYSMEDVSDYDLNKVDKTKLSGTLQQYYDDALKESTTGEVTIGQFKKYLNDNGGSIYLEEFDSPYQKQLKYALQLLEITKVAKTAGSEVGKRKQAAWEIFRSDKSAQIGMNTFKDVEYFKSLGEKYKDDMATDSEVFKKVNAKAVQMGDEYKEVSNIMGTTYALMTAYQEAVGKENSTPEEFEQLAATIYRQSLPDYAKKTVGQSTPFLFTNVRSAQYNPYRRDKDSVPILKDKQSDMIKKIYDAASEQQKVFFLSNDINKVMSTINTIDEADTQTNMQGSKEVWGDTPDKEVIAKQMRIYASERGIETALASSPMTNKMEMFLNTYMQAPRQILEKLSSLVSDLGQLVTMAKTITGVKDSASSWFSYIPGMGG